MEDAWLTVDDIAQQLKVHPETVRRWLREGKLQGVLISRSGGYRIRQSSVDRFIDDRAAEMGKAAA